MTRLIIVPDEISEMDVVPTNTDWWACSVKTKNCYNCPHDCPVLALIKQGQQSILSLPSISVEELHRIADGWLDWYATEQNITDMSPEFGCYFQECLKAKEAGLK